jgi:hypothetical protein
MDKADLATYKLAMIKNLLYNSQLYTSYYQV